MAESRTIEIDIPAGTDVGRMIAAARTRAAGAGVTLTGTASEGRFEGVATGGYRVEGARLLIEVEKKPAFVPWPMVMSQLEKAFRSA
jgi:hypothetical protein